MIDREDNRTSLRAMRRPLMTAALAAAAMFLFAGQAAATSSDRFGIQDDAWLRWGPGTRPTTLESRLDTLGVKMVRFTLCGGRRDSAGG